jgi:hypothetical protein
MRGSPTWSPTTSTIDITESESMRFGSGFGIATDIQTRNGTLFVVSLSDGAIYKISKHP